MTAVTHPPVHAEPGAPGGILDQEEHDRESLARFPGAGDVAAARLLCTGPRPMDDPDLSPGKAQQLKRISTEEVALGDSVFMTLAMYAKHQEKHAHCECTGCKTVRKLIERALRKGWRFPFDR